MRKPILDMSRFRDSSEKTSRFVEDRFDLSVISMRFILEKYRSPQLRLSRNCPRLPQLNSVQQRLTQDQMRARCEFIQHNVDPGYDYTVIEFGKKHQVWNGQGFTLVEMAIRMKLVGYEAEWNYLDEDVGNNITIFLRGHEYKHSEAYLKSTGADGIEFFFELDEFSLLSFKVPDSLKEDNIESQEFFFNNLTSIFTFYNRNNNSLFVDNASLSIESIFEELRPIRV